FHIRTFGCQMNSYDSARLADLLTTRLGWRPVTDATEADLVVVNTCHVREKAEEKLFSELGRLHKEVFPRRGRSRIPAAVGEGAEGVSPREVIFVVAGCVAQSEGEAIRRRAPFVDLVVGPQGYHELPDLLRRLPRRTPGSGRRLPIEVVADDPAVKFAQLPARGSTGPVAMVTVQEGCDRFCTYCVVPLTRGREWSRPVASVEAEVREVLRGGAREVILLGQNVNAYRGVDEEGVGYDLALLIRRLALLPGLERLRFVTSHPADMSAALVEVFAELPELCPYLHLPIQSGSDRILAAMGRGHTVAEYRSWVGRLRAARADLCLASDFIVGFPGESESDFAETLALVEELQFDHAYAFRFSPRPGTPASRWEGGIPEAESMERLQRLQAVLHAVQWRSNRGRVGRVEAVLVEGPARLGRGEWSGRAPGFQVVNFPAVGDPTGRIVPVRITEGLPNSLRGVPLGVWGGDPLPGDVEGSWAGR
ncbi:MAG: tRNA (N6-isopentenyl adenosine(37)-C2)-methylthiotransferase MiaB, partial [Magnetococcales bacterium]|nr:tRNA (N6-isopentenyl adenosine(37)-C2)-methylthiotransferase MiaB [Magnetococcales bacterium]